jgi:hypothetical protein
MHFLLPKCAARSVISRSHPYWFNQLITLTEGCKCCAWYVNILPFLLTKYLEFKILFSTLRQHSKYATKSSRATNHVNMEQQSQGAATLGDGLVLIPHWSRAVPKGTYIVYIRKNNRTPITPFLDNGGREGLWNVELLFRIDAACRPIRFYCVWSPRKLQVIYSKYVYFPQGEIPRFTSI